MKRKKLMEVDVMVEFVFMFKWCQMLKMLGISVIVFFFFVVVQVDLLDWFKGYDCLLVLVGKVLEFVKFVEWQVNLMFILEDKVVGYNNFYEFGFDKVDLVVNVGSLCIDFWMFIIGGEVVKFLIFDYDDLIKCFLLEECIYCMCCVEVWLMVVFWVGFLLYKLLVLVEFISSVCYVVFKIFYVLD